MPVPNEGTTTLPSDAGGRFFVGIWDGTNFYALRDDGAHNLKVALGVSLPAGTALIGKVNLVEAGGNGLVGIADNADNVVPLSTPSLLRVGAELFGFNTTSGVWNRLHIDASGNLLTALGAALPAGTAIIGKVNMLDANGVGLLTVTDADAQATANLLGVLSRLEAFDGTNWHRLRTAPNAASTGALGVLAAAVQVWDPANGVLRNVESPNQGDGRTGQNHLAMAPFGWNAAGSYAAASGAFDRWQNNAEGTALASAARTATTRSPNLGNPNCRGVLVAINITAASGTGGLQLQISPGIGQTGNQLGLGTQQSSWPTSPITTTGVYAFLLYPGLVQQGSASPTAYNIDGYSNAALGRMWGCNVVHTDASSYTYAVYYSLIV